jgi:hypothetical protein
VKLIPLFLKWDKKDAENFGVFVLPFEQLRMAETKRRPLDAFVLNTLYCAEITIGKDNCQAFAWHSLANAFCRKIMESGAIPTLL